MEVPRTIFLRRNRNGWQTCLGNMSKSFHSRPASSSKGTRLQQRKSRRESSVFSSIQEARYPYPRLCACNCLIMRGSIYYAHKGISRLSEASFFFFFPLFLSFSSVVGVGKEGQSLKAPATPLAPWIPTGFHFPAHRLSHLGVWARSEWRQHPSALMNSFQAACCRSHLLLRPGVGKRSGIVFVRVVMGRGGGQQEEGGWRRGQRVFPALRGAEETPSPSPAPVGWAVGPRPDSRAKRWSGIKTSPGEPWGWSARKEGRERRASKNPVDKFIKIDLSLSPN